MHIASALGFPTVLARILYLGGKTDVQDHAGHLAWRVWWRLAAYGVWIVLLTLKYQSHIMLQVFMSWFVSPGFIF